jgi:hypothetical protein
MQDTLITPIFFHYKFLDELCKEVAAILSIDINDKEKYQELKISVFLNFNRYLIDNILLLPMGENDYLLPDLTKAMEIADEENTLKILDNRLDFFGKIKKEFIGIINKNK